MDLTVREHIENLEARLATLNAEFMEEKNADRRNQLQSEIRAVEMALSHFRAALEAEKTLSST